jgi:hypothetical protein
VGTRVIDSLSFSINTILLCFDGGTGTYWGLWEPEKHTKGGVNMKMGFCKELLKAVCLIGITGISQAATFSDNFDNPTFTNSHWKVGDPLLPQTWSFPSLGGADLGYQGTVDTYGTEDPSSQVANNWQQYYNANLYIESLVRIDSHAEAYSKTNKAIISFSASEETQYLAQLRLDYDNVQTPIMDLYLSVHSDGPPDQDQILVSTPVSIDFDTFYKMVIQIDSDQSMVLSLYDLDDALLGYVNSPKVLAADYGAVAIGGRYKTTFNDFYISGTPVPIPGAVWLLSSGLLSLIGLSKFKC